MSETQEAHSGAEAATAGDPCPECDGKGYTVSQYTWEYGTEWEPHLCEDCEGSGVVIPVVETEEFVEVYPCQR